MKRSVLLFVLPLLSGCSLTATMIPVEGPMARQDPVPVINVKVGGVYTGSGELSFRLPEGERCSGRWSTADSSGMTFSSGTLINQYGTTYLQGFSTSTGSGQTPGAALVTCSGGHRTVDIQFVTGDSGHGFGIGKDNKGNVYRLVF